MQRSRLSKRIEQKTKKNLTLSILGIILVALFALKFGIPFLVNFSLFLSGSKNKEEVRIQNPSFIAPPVLASLPDATSSAKIAISGVTLKNRTINFYLNDELIDTVKAKDDGTFSFDATIKPGENTMKSKAVVDSKESDFSNTITVSFKSAPPSLNITSPSDNQSFSKDQNIAEIKGTTDPNVKVTINGLWAISDSVGNFSYNFPLGNGENKISVLAQDSAGNKTAKEIKINYSP